MSIKDIRLGFYKFSGSTSRYPGIPLGIAIAAGLAVFIFFNPLQPGTETLHAILIGVLTLLGLIWMAVWGWYFVTFRYIFYFIAWIISLIRRFLANGLVRFLILLFAVVLLQRGRTILMFYRPGSITLFDPGELLQLSFIITTLSLTLIILIFILLLKARKRIVISEFLNHTGYTELDTPVKGIAPAIVSEIFRLVNLYRTIDELHPSAKKNILDATISVTTIDKDFDDALGGQFEVQVGPGMKINLGSLLKLLGRINRGPKLCGCLQREGNKLVLTAWITGGRMQGNWRVHRREISDFSIRPTTGKISKMIEEITCRMFADLNKLGSPRWEVVKLYAEGLRKYRETERTENNRVILLHEAKTAFITALVKDNRFAECYYNLGIIYNKLGNDKSAIAAFRKALEENPDDYNSYSGLANCFREVGDYENAGWFCEQAINLRPSNPKAWNLYVVILYEKWYKKSGEYKRDIFQGKLNVEIEIIPKAAIAVMLSWQALCHAATKGELTKVHKDMAVLCTRNLAALKGMKCSRWIGWIFKQAFFLSPDDNDLYFELGKYYYRRENYPAARKAFFKIYEDALDVEDSLRYWASYTHTNAKLNNSKYLQITKDGITHFLDITADMLQNGKADLKDKILYHKLDQCIRQMKTSMDLLKDNLEKGLKESLRNEIEFIYKLRYILREQVGIQNIDKLIFHYKNIYRSSTLARLDWAGAQLDISTAKRLFELDDNFFPIILLKKAIEKLEKSYPRQIKKLSINMYLGQAYLNIKLPKNALFHARKAVNLNPFKPEERLLLGRVHRALKNYDKALAELESSFKLDPNSLEILTVLGDTYKEKGENACEPKEIKKAYNAAVEIFEKALIIIRSTSILENEEGIKNYAEFIGIIHFYLGIFHYEMVKYDSSAAHFRTAAQMDYEPVFSLIKAGWSYINAGSFSQAKTALDEAENRYKKQSKKDKKHLIEIRLGQAAAFVEGAVSIGEEKRMAYNDANDRLEKVAGDIKEFKEKDRETKEDDREFVSLAWAIYYECRGLIRLKEGNCLAALTELEQAVDHRANARLYLRIAEIHRQCAAGSIASGMRSHISLARTACTLCRKHDLRQKYGNDIEQLNKELDELEKKV